MQNEPRSKKKTEKYIALFNQYKEWVQLVHAQTGKNLITQFHEIRSLRHSGGQCGATDYYWHNLYNDDYMMGRGRQDFLGWRLGQEISLALNARESALPGVDKLAFAIIAGSSGLPIPEIVATYYNSSQISNLLGLHLKNKEAVAAFLRDQSIYPIFGKPAYTLGGYGAAYLTGYDSASDHLHQIDGSTIPLNQFLNRLEISVHEEHKPEHGFLFQNILNLDQKLTEFTQWQAISSVRIVCLNDSGKKIHPIRAVWKISVPPNYQDNFARGVNGNLLANIDSKTGKINRLLKGFWPTGEILEQHPLSKQTVDGFQLPYWNEILNICQLGGQLFPSLKIQHWDIALTNNGPVVLEINDYGGIQIIQAHGYGLLTEQTREFLKLNANLKVYPWIKAL